MKKIVLFFMIFLLLPITTFANDTEIKNVIFMIGDGMGVNHLEWAKAETGEELIMDSMPIKGYRNTNSFSGLTDSAAGGTALACGLLAINYNVGRLSIPINDYNVVVADYVNLCEKAQIQGKKTGIITSDENTGATPGAFSAHTSTRYEYEKMSEQQLNSNLDLLWSTADGIINEEMATESGWTYVDNINEIYELPKDSKSIAQFTGNVAYDDGDEFGAPLSTLTARGIELLDGSENGFFLMVEGAHIDKYSHNNDSEGMIKSLIEFDKAIGEAINFAKEDGHTMVIVTADHETGGIVWNEDNETWEFTSDYHTDVDVPLRVFGDYGMLNDGETIKNVAVARYVANVMGIDEFPSFEIRRSFKPIYSLIVERLVEER